MEKFQRIDNYLASMTGRDVARGSILSALHKFDAKLGNPSFTQDGPRLLHSPFLGPLGNQNLIQSQVRPMGIRLMGSRFSSDTPENRSSGAADLLVNGFKNNNNNGEFRRPSREDPKRNVLHLGQGLDLDLSLQLKTDGRHKRSAESGVAGEEEDENDADSTLRLSLSSPAYSKIRKLNKDNTVITACDRNEPEKSRTASTLDLTL